MIVENHTLKGMNENVGGIIFMLSYRGGWGNTIAVCLSGYNVRVGQVMGVIGILNIDPCRSLK